MSIQHLKTQFHCDGSVEWLGTRPGRKCDMSIIQTASLVPGQGIEGDRFKGNLKSKRQVSLIQQEHIDMMSKMLGGEVILPEMLRRNIVISGLNLLSLKGAMFQLGTATLEMTEQCHPCSRMEEVLGVGGFNLMRGHGGILARVLDAGEVSIGDKLRFLQLK